MGGETDLGTAGAYRRVSEPLEFVPTHVFSGIDVDDPYGVEINTERQIRTARFLSKVPFIGKHFAETEQNPIESEAYHA